MNTRQVLFAAGAVLLSLIVLDGLWLTVIMGDTYASLIGPLMLAEPRWTPAILFYLLYTAALCVFAVAPALRTNDKRSAAWLGAFLGLVAYGTYDLSNYATLSDWPWQMAAIDMAWGVVLSCAAASAGFWAARRGAA